MDMMERISEGPADRVRLDAASRLRNQAARRESPVGAGVDSATPPVEPDHGGTGGDVPPAFYSDEPPLLPPPGHPHWREWPEGSAYEPAPRWIPYAVIGFLITASLIHILFIFLLAR